jgi:hypothetical protein
MNKPSVGIYFFSFITSVWTAHRQSNNDLLTTECFRPTRFKLRRQEASASYLTTVAYLNDCNTMCCFHSTATSGGDAGVQKSPWDDLFGAVTSSSTTTTSGFDDKFDAFGPNGHVTGNVDDGTADDDFLGLRSNASSSTLTAVVDNASNTWPSNAAVRYGDDLFGTGAFASSAFGGTETAQSNLSSGGGSRARPRPAAATAANPANPFSVALQAVTANRCVIDVAVLGANDSGLASVRRRFTSTCCVGHVG